MKSINKFLALPLQEKYELVKTLIFLVFIKSTLVLLPFSWFKKLYNFLLKRTAKNYKSNSEITRLIYFIKAISANLPLGLTCLPQALTLKYYLRNEAEVKLIVGVNLEQTFKAHAWVEKNTTFLIGDLPFETYTPLWTWT